MNLKKKFKKIVLLVYTITCFIGSSVAIYVGYDVFHGRMRLFWIFSAYIVLLTAIAIFFGRRLIGVIFE